MIPEADYHHLALDQDPIQEHTPRPPCPPCLARPAPGTGPAPSTATPPAPLEPTPTATPSRPTPVPVTRRQLDQTTGVLEQLPLPAGGQV